MRIARAYTEFSGSLLFLAQRLHELDNDLRSAIAKREKIDMDGKVGESAQRL
jgi:hypothetical protein